MGLWKKQKGICAYCGKKMSMNPVSRLFATFDHVVPLSKGGKWSEDNIVLACRRCNEKKSNKIWGFNDEGKERPPEETERQPVGEGKTWGIGKIK